MAAREEMSDSGSPDRAEVPPTSTACLRVGVQ